MIINLLNGDSRALLEQLPPESVDCCVTDGPYGMNDKEPDMNEVLRHWLAGDDAPITGGGFMNKDWDKFVPGPAIWKQVFRVLKPGGYLLSFYSARTYDMGALAIRLAGFEIRDQLQWIYGSGFPKSRDIGKDDPQFEGWGTALKPCFEPIVMARKPFRGTVLANMLAHNTGALNIDACRIEAPEGKTAANGRPSLTGAPDGYDPAKGNQPDTKGRWPGNVLHDNSEEVRECFPDSRGAKGSVKTQSRKRTRVNTFNSMPPAAEAIARTDKDTSAARFFFHPKALGGDRNYGLDGEAVAGGEMTGRKEGSAGLNDPRAGAGRGGGSLNPHPTVKPIAVMRWLISLVAFPGAVILDPFMGSGTTGIAAVLGGYSFIGFDSDASYCLLAGKRISAAQREYHQQQQTG